MTQSKKLLSILAIIVVVGAATLLIADTYSSWSGTATSDGCTSGGIAFVPFANWSGVWNETVDTFRGTWTSGSYSGAFYADVNYTGGQNCPRQAVGYWTLDDYDRGAYEDSAGHFWMCFRDDDCWGEWNTSEIDTLDCEGTMTGDEQ